MTVLISGSNGFLGSSLLKYLSNIGNTVIALKRSSSDTYRIDEYLKKVIFYNIDETELSTIFKEHSIDIVINTVTNYGRKSSNLKQIIGANLVFPLELLEESLKSDVKAFINADTMLDKSLNHYALSKSQFVDWMKILSNEKLKMINIKIEHMYGPKDDENKFIYWLVNQLKNNAKNIDLTSGVQKRDFIYITDIISAFEKIIINLNILSNYNEFELGSGNSVQVKDVVLLIEQELKKLQEVRTNLNFGVIPYRSNENMNMTVDISAIQSLGWEAKVSLSEGIKAILKEEI